MSGKPSTAPKDAAKALKAAKSARVGSYDKKVKVRTKTHFYKPKTRMGGDQDIKYVRSLPLARGNLDKHYKVVRKPLVTDKAMKKIEENNTLVFLCDPKANKKQIKAAMLSVRLSVLAARGEEGGRGRPRAARRDCRREAVARM
jgi:large subunit ribosomal protein L23Ae